MNIQNKLSFIAKFMADMDDNDKKDLYRCKMLLEDLVNNYKGSDSWKQLRCKCHDKIDNAVPPLGFNKTYNDLVKIFGEEHTVSPFGGSAAGTTLINTNKGTLQLKRGDSDDHYDVTLIESGVENPKENLVYLTNEERLILWQYARRRQFELNLIAKNHWAAKYKKIVKKLDIKD